MADPNQPATPGEPATAMSRRQLEASIVAKAWRDPLYKQHLLANPRGMLQHEIASIDPTISLPPDLAVHVHQETPQDFHLVLPRDPKDISLGELAGERIADLAPQTVAVVVNVIGSAIGNVVAPGLPVVGAMNAAVTSSNVIAASAVIGSGVANANAAVVSMVVA